MRNSRSAVHFGQSLELKGEIDEALNTKHMTSTRPFRFPFHTSRLRAHAYIDNSRVCSIILVLVALHTLFTSAFLVNYVTVPLNWENKNSLLCKLWVVTGNQAVTVLATSKQKVNLIFCCLINIYQQTIELCKYVTPRLIPPCHVVRAIDSCSLDSPNT